MPGVQKKTRAIHDIRADFYANKSSAKERRGDQGRTGRSLETTAGNKRQKNIGDENMKAKAKAKTQSEGRKGIKSDHTKLNDAMDKQMKNIAKAVKEVEKTRKTMTISETKLGVTLVISKEDCEKLGLAGNMTTKEAIKELKKKLGLRD